MLPFFIASTFPLVALPLATLVSALLGWAMFLVSLFLILLILVQRGRGGGLTGALGGPGGQSAFGTKAGDLFTRITSFTALGWIALCAFSMWLLGTHPPSVAIDPPPAVSASPGANVDTSSDFIDLGGLSGVPGASEPAADTTVGAEAPGDQDAVPTDDAAVDSPVELAPAGNVPDTTPAPVEQPSDSGEAGAPSDAATTPATSTPE